MLKRLGRAVLLLPLLGHLLVGCGTTRVVRLDTGYGEPLEYKPSTWDEQVKVGEDDFKEALAQLLLEVPLSVRPSQAGSLLLTASAGEAMDMSVRYALRRDYGRWCEAREAPGDCLSLLENGLGFDKMSRLKAAVAFAIDPVWQGVAEELGDTLKPEVLFTMVVTGVATYIALLAFPEPVVSKAIAVLLTAWMVAYLGTGPFLHMASACFTLKKATDKATTFAELEEAGTRFGREMGLNGTRIVVMLVTAALGGGLKARGPTLPGFPQALRLLEAQAGLRLLASGGVRSIAVTEGGILIGLVPGAVAMSASGTNGGGPAANKDAAADSGWQFPRSSLRGVSLKWLQRNKPSGWRQVPTRNNEGWIWLDQNGVERLRFMRPNGMNPSANQWARQSNGYFRWQDAKGNFLDIDGKVVSPSHPEFQELTHIPYEGL